MAVLVVIILLCTLWAYLFLHSMRFGTPPKGDELKKIQQSANYRSGQFQNISLTPSLTEGASFFGILKKFYFDKHHRRTPTSVLPSVKINLSNLDPAKNIPGLVRALLLFYAD